jgi:hypothetical protein
MSSITDDVMRAMLAKAKPYTIVILKSTPKRHEPGVDKIVWEHGRRNFDLRAAGKLAIVCRVTDGSDVAGIGIFHADPEETRRIMDADPGVKSGVFLYEIHPSISFPGDALPG